MPPPKRPQTDRRPAAHDKTASLTRAPSFRAPPEAVAVAIRLRPFLAGEVRDEVRGVTAVEVREAERKIIVRQLERPTQSRQISRSAAVSSR